MASIELSAGWMTPMVSRILRVGDASLTTSTAAVSGLLPQGPASLSGYTADQYRGTMCLMKGTIPATPTLSNYNARASDMLVQFHNLGTTPWSTYSVTNTNPASLTSNFISASASGTATWFWWYCSSVHSIVIDSVNQDNMGLWHQVIGTVGIAGSGADLEMVSTSITAGELYRIANLKIAFPSIWTY
jgi:hypothetical protein